MTLVSEAFLAITFVPAIVFGLFALSRGEQKAGRAVVARALRPVSRRPDRDLY